MILFFIAIALSLYIVEFLLLFLSTENKKIENTIIKKMRYSVVEEYRTKGVDAFPMASASDLNGKPDPNTGPFTLGHISDALLVSCNETGEWSVYHTDEHGYHNPLGSHNPDLQLVLLGDSFVEGECVQEKEDVTSLLREKGYSALNLGFGGNGPLLELASLIEYAKPLKPKRVLWFFYEGNDLSDLKNEMLYPMIKNYFDTREYSQNLNKRQEEIDEKIKAKIQKIETAEQEREKKNAGNSFPDTLSLMRIRVLVYQNLAKIKKLSRQDEEKKELQETINTFNQILERANTEVRSWGGTLYFIYLPSTIRYTDSTKYDNDGYRPDILSTAEKLGIASIDFHQVFSKHKDSFSLYFPFYRRKIESHYTAEGYKLIADTITEYLKNED